MSARPRLCILDACDACVHENLSAEYDAGSESLSQILESLVCWCLSRQPLEAPPVKSTGMDNILEKTEKHMTPAEVEDRAQRKLNWQAFADEAATSWKAMFPQAKRQRGADRDPPRHPIDYYLVRCCRTLTAKRMPSLAVPCPHSPSLANKDALLWHRHQYHALQRHKIPVQGALPYAALPSI